MFLTTMHPYCNPVNQTLFKIKIIKLLFYSILVGGVPWNFLNVVFQPIKPVSTWRLLRLAPAATLASFYPNHVFLVEQEVLVATAGCRTCVAPPLKSKSP